jgi:hypothetical protein
MGSIRKYDSNLSKVDWLNHTCIDENYDLTKPNGEEKDIKFICNLFIHSYVFVVSGDGTETKG